MEDLRLSISDDRLSPTPSTVANFLISIRHLVTLSGIELSLDTPKGGKYMLVHTYTPYVLVYKNSFRIKRDLGMASRKA